MDWKRSHVCTRFLTVSFFLSFSFFALACVEMETPDTYRMMFFQARMGNTSALQIFNYTPAMYAGYHPDPDGADRVRNAKEWLDQVGGDVVLEDILSIQYETTPDSLLLAYKKNRIKSVFEDNSFMQALAKSPAKALLEYLLFSKQVEATEAVLLNGFESWNADADEVAVSQKAKQALFLLARKRLSSAKGDFLRKRYAYQLCRLAYQLKNYAVAIKTYESYFKKFDGDALMNVWSTLFYAQSLDATKKGAKANYFYSLVFDHCDSKKLRSHQLFHTDDKTFFAGLKLTKNVHEKAVMWVMHCINYPAPALNDLKTIVGLEPKSPYLSFLIAREINKLEDWICTPGFTTNMPSLSPQWDLSVARAHNLAVDKAYLQKFKAFLQKERAQERGEMAQYLTLCLAHTCFLDDKSKEGLEYLNGMGLTENSSIELQKNIEKAWVSAKTSDVTGDNFKDQFVVYCRKLQRLAKSDNAMNKTLYTLLRCVAREYETKGDFATAGLLAMKSDQFKQRYDTAFYGNRPVTLKDTYDKIAYFDLNAGVGDIDHLIQLIMKRDKSEFEDFICDQHLGSLNFYRDLQGTIAFRNNDLKTAARIFKLISPDFWRSHYGYAQCLNEDPFLPKVLTKKRNFKYNFDKSRFVRQLIDLQDKAKRKSGVAEASLMLGNAYFNCSYWGNSWMMVKYVWSGGEGYRMHTPDALGYSLPLQQPTVKAVLVSDNYYNCKLAAHYYRQALDDPKATNEQRAFACLMLHECHYSPWLFATADWNMEKLPAYSAQAELREFYAKYADTKTYHDYRCPLLDAFIANK